MLKLACKNLTRLERKMTVVDNQRRPVCVKIRARVSALQRMERDIIGSGLAREYGQALIKRLSFLKPHGIGKLA